jgi:hypothetical protein
LDKPLVYVDVTELRRIFNETDYDARVRRGECVVVLVRDEVPAKPIAGEPEGTRSQFIQYRRLDGRTVASAHRYMRPDGSIGASGMPDPKRIYLADRILALRPDEPPVAPKGDEPPQAPS